MKGKWFSLIILFLVSGVLTGFVFATFYFQKQTDKLFTDFQRILEKFELLKSNISNSYIYNDISLPVEDTLANKICFWYKKEHCDICVDYVFQNLQDFNCRNGNNCIIILTGKSNRRNIFLKQKFFGINIPVVFYNDSVLWCPLDNLEVPCLFFLNEHKTISNFYIPSKEIPEITNRYLLTLLEKQKQ